MLLEHNPDSFMTGRDPFVNLDIVEKTSSALVQDLTFEPHHEGFMGIPHGGLAMGLCLDQWRGVGRPLYPVTVNFKFGGSGLPIGAPALFSVKLQEESRQGPRIIAEIIKHGETRPYLRADIAPAKAESASIGLPEPPGNDFRMLPYYENCFVCGHHRTAPGLRRRFRVHTMNESPVTTVLWGLDNNHHELVEDFLIGKEELHPAVLISIFDENTAWAGFFRTGGAGLSVRLDFTLLRPVGKSEKLMFMGWPAGIRGNPKAPRFFRANGMIVSLADPVNPEPVAHGWGEWLIMAQYTRQIKENLLPREDWQWIFPDQ